LDDLPNGHDIEFNRVYDDFYKNLFLNKLSSKGLTLDQFIENHIKQSFERVKKFLVELENDGVKIILLTWPDEYLDYIKKDEWAKSLLVDFQHKGKNYESLNQLMNSKNDFGELINPEMTIKYDTQSFIDTPKDHHPSLKCHQLISESIIRKIEVGY